jgi:DNA-binding XRE family transcriptional regulator
MGLLNSLSERLKQSRIDSGLNQTDFAAKLGIKQSYLSAMERGIRPVPTKIATALIEQFEVNQDWLFSSVSDISNDVVVPPNGTPRGTPIQKVGKGGTTRKNTEKLVGASVKPENIKPTPKRERAQKMLIDYQNKLGHELQREDRELSELKNELDYLSWCFEDARRVMEELEVPYRIAATLKGEEGELVPYTTFKAMAVRDLKRRLKYRDIIKEFGQTVGEFTVEITVDKLREDFWKEISEDDSEEPDTEER